MGNLKCKIFGHKWGPFHPYSQHCQRCLAYRVKVIDKLKQATGDKCVEWKILEMPKLKKLRK